MSSLLISNPVTDLQVTRRKKRKKITHTHDQVQNPSQNSIQWKSELQQQVYSSKLLQALRHVRLSSSPSPTCRGRAVREAADRVLAATAKGRTRWSCAILTRRMKIKFSKNRRLRTTKTTVTAGNRLSILRRKSKNLQAAVQRKVRFLGRLIPGCRKESHPVILEEASDYILALQMQIRAMSSLADMLSSSISDALPSTQSPPPPPI
ncbi:transcription factor bHLH148-like [Impatiens glandulifera]|uniref:transcription factor bHLH148-like n=1 Tax=Impatiens glandulifera TaxID=253017 RepID=UPI001FB06960|nr:transcription factor bHLH148-like [Impatiens glandulifera]